MRSQFDRRIRRTILASVPALFITVSAAGNPLSVPQHAGDRNQIVEVTVSGSLTLRNPLIELEPTAIVTTPTGTTQHVPMFWDGGSNWKFRYASPTPGQYTYTIICTGKQDQQLLNAHGLILIRPTTTLPQTLLNSHGPITITPDHRHFMHADGTPFLWLADTWWKCLSSRLSYTNFNTLVQDRRSKGFSVVQIVCGPYPDEDVLDLRMRNEGGMPYESRDFARSNPAYFSSADKRIAALESADIVPAIVGGWGRGGSLEALGMPAYKRHWRNLIARYGAGPVVWIAGGEAGGPGWTELAKYIRATDPFHHLITMHPGTSARDSVTDEAAIDFDMLQTGHGDWTAAHAALPQILRALGRKPAMPALIGEACYEGHMQSAFQDVERWLFWTSMLSGAAGHTYGAAGVWHAGIQGDPGISPVYDWTTWQEGMRYPGSAQVGLGRKLLSRYPWQRFEQHNEWTSKGCFAAGIPGGTRFMFQPKNGVYNWNGTVINNIEAGGRYRLTYWDPATGRSFPAGIIYRKPNEAGSAPGFAGAPIYRLAEDVSPAEHWKDTGSTTLKSQEAIIASKNTITLYRSANSPANPILRVKAKSDAEAGIVLKYRDNDNYVVALYSPLLHALYIHERINAQWGSQLGRVDLPELNSPITLIAGCHGKTAFAALTVGKASYSTPSVALKQSWSGPCGIWMYQIGDQQTFKQIEIGNCPTLPAPKANPETVIYSDTYVTPGVPSPQDWLLIMERI